MREALDLQLELGCIAIEQIEIEPSRDDIQKVLLGLQHLYKDPEVLNQMLALMEERMLPDVNFNNGRPGMLCRVRHSMPYADNRIMPRLQINSLNMLPYFQIMSA